MPTLGQILKERRQSKGLTLEEVGAATKIKLSFLRALEEEDYRLLPDELYLVGFLRDYAAFLGLDPDELDARFRAELHRRSRGEETRVVIEKVHRWTLWHSLLATLCGLILLYLFLWAWLIPRIERPPSLASQPGLPAAVVPAGPKVQSPPAPAPRAKYVLKARATELTWIGLWIDGKERKQALLKAGEVAEWSAEQGFSITVGNAGGVELFLNGKPLPKLGVSGQVIRNLALPRPEEKEG